jgi:hypothetical protein
MFGKYFASTFSGSMMAAGPEVFAVWGYVIAHAVDSRVELNPRLLAAVIGSTPERMLAAIERLCASDAESRSKEQEGRRLMREGEFQYFVVNHDKYRSIRDEEGRREYNREKKREERARKALPGPSMQSKDVSPSNAPEDPRVFSGQNLPVTPAVNDNQRLSNMSANTEAETDAEAESEPTTPARTRIATPVPTEPNSARSLNSNPNPKDQNAEICADVYASLVAIGITGLTYADPVLRMLVDRGIGAAEVIGVAQQGARSGRGNWGWVQAAVLGKRRDAAAIGQQAASIAPPAAPPAPAVSLGPLPPETHEARARRRARLGFPPENPEPKPPSDLEAQTLAALQQKRGEPSFQGDKEDA